MRSVARQWPRPGAIGTMRSALSRKAFGEGVEASVVIAAAYRNATAVGTRRHAPRRARRRRRTPASVEVARAPRRDQPGCPGGVLAAAQQVVGAVERDEALRVFRLRVDLR